MPLFHGIISRYATFRNTVCFTVCLFISDMFHDMFVQSGLRWAQGTKDMFDSQNGDLKATTKQSIEGKY